ncbi:hypothetical protein HD806DRAFT_494040 [Xylariaceae sp. AK1471]|nr:hypothetical protein HD806DRAFT_494040 [Xylariaceae sp. AK1471]
MAAWNALIMNNGTYITSSLDCHISSWILCIIPVIPSLSQHTVHPIHAICLAATPMAVITLHSKYVTPTNLSMALTELVGDFAVELRQNVYNISSTEDFSVDDLLQTCERVRMSLVRAYSRGAYCIKY